MKRTKGKALLYYNIYRLSREEGAAPKVEMCSQETRIYSEKKGMRVKKKGYGKTVSFKNHVFVHLGLGIWVKIMANDKR